MVDVEILAGDLTASREDRVVSGLLLPYGEQGNTNLGKFTVDQGVFQLPADPGILLANLYHDRRAPIATGLTLTDSPAGLFASWKVAATPEGDDLLAAIAEKRPDAPRRLSVEATGVVIRGGKAVAGRVYGAAFCKQGAFPSAELLAEDVGDLPEDTHSESVTTEEITLNGTTYVRKTTSTYDTQTTPKAGEDDTDADTAQEDEMDDELQASTPPAVAPGGGAPLPKNRRSAARVGPTGGELHAQLAAAVNSGRAGELLAALDQITQADVFDVVHVPQYLGELWNGVTFEKRFVPLINHAELTAAKIIGWRFVEGKKPEVDDYAGGGAEVPSNEVDTEAVEAVAARIAAGWNVDRIHRDFPNPEFWAAFFRAGNESYARKIDGKVRTFLGTVGNATPLLVDPATPAALGVSEAAYKLVKGGLGLVRSDRGNPTFGILSDDLFEEWAFTRRDDELAYLSASFGLQGGSGFTVPQIVNDSSLPAGTATVGIKGVATLHELGGASPLRVSAEDIAKGNLLEAMFGYWSIIQHDKGALIRVSDDPEA
ncbi:hypothetical protein CWIS_09710 [Cellulomonas sp. A375-1]|uniref:phage major capsid protein n=1 Tax=Cellulomonas sp. A375-1 TaxID=1672219 RepID=UPI00065272FC|nr:hypothetical protein [Cellulomonas sp. A375-1]KMM45606.1 hypothetical protein CWIS_09710 [Cellulomonas sp. A375-1]